MFNPGYADQTPGVALMGVVLRRGGYMVYR